MKQTRLSVPLWTLTALTAVATGTMTAAENIPDAERQALVFGFKFPNGFLSGMSSNGKWGTFQPPTYDEEDCIPYRLNLMTGELERLPLEPEFEEPGSIAVAYDVTDDGETLVGSYNNMPAYYRDGRWEYLPLPAGTRGYTGYVTSTSVDGRVMVGWISRSFTSFRPLIWIDGEVKVPGNLPDYDEMYGRGIIDAQDYADHKAKEQTPNCAFFKVSDDGRTVLSGVDHNYPGWGCSYIIYDIESDTYDWIADDELGGLKGYVDGAAMSNSGEWVSASVVTTSYSPDGSWDDRHENVLYHVPTRTFTRGKGGGSIIDNDGTVYRGTIPALTDGIGVPVEKLLKEKYGIDFTEATGLTMDGYGFMFDISSDGRTLLGQPTMRNAAYSVTLPIPLKEAADGVNLLADWTSFPPSDTPLSVIDEVMVKFTATSKYNGTAQGSIMRDGVEIARSTEVEGKGSNTWSLKFENVALDEGATYTVVLPDGMFTGQNEASRNVAVEWNLTGRGMYPMNPLSVSPADGASVSELGAYNMISLTYDTYPQTSGLAGELYEVGFETPLCQLSVAADGNSVYLYPAATRNLIRGKEYEVVLPAGAITDLTGHCPSDELRLRYTGVFAPEADKHGTSLFFEDFESPNQALNNFLQYEGDHLTPMLVMQGWGFDADNTPWNFSVRDEDGYDYCAASHSAYFGGGTSDDWLVVPMVDLDSDKYSLTFKSQSYLDGCDDRLKVIVWPCDEVFGSLDAATVERMRTEGTVIYDEYQSPGADQELLRGDWRENRISLAQWEGQKIYIAFVNNNDQNGSAIFVDDICVEYEGDFTISTTVPSLAVALDEVPVTATVTPLEGKEVTRLEARWETADGVYSGSMSIDNPEADIYGEIHLEFDGCMPLTPGERTDYTLSVSLDGETQRIQGYVNNLMFEVPRRVLIEEGTGTWCGWCPQGMIALEYIADTYGDLAVPVAVHYNDQMAIDSNSYAYFLGYGAYPSARVNRHAQIAYPVYGDPSTGRYSFTSPGGNETFVDLLESELAIPALASLDITGLSLSESGRLNVDVETRAAMALEEMPYNLFTVLTEDGITGIQNNNLSGAGDPLFGDFWPSQGDMARCEYEHVARAIAGTSYYGEGGLLPHSLGSGEIAAATVSLDVPAGVNPDNAHVVVALIDITTGRVANAVRRSLKESGVSSVAGPEGFAVCDGTVTYAGTPVGVEVMDTRGVRLPNSGLKGLVIVRAVTSDGRVATAKLMI